MDLTDGMVMENNLQLAKEVLRKLEKSKEYPLLFQEKQKTFFALNELVHKKQNEIKFEVEKLWSSTLNTQRKDASICPKIIDDVDLYIQLYCNNVQPPDFVVQLRKMCADMMVNIRIIASHYEERV